MTRTRAVLGPVWCRADLTVETWPLAQVSQAGDGPHVPWSQLCGGCWAHEQRDELVANQSEEAPELCGTGGRSQSVTVLWATTQQPPCL